MSDPTLAWLDAVTYLGSGAKNHRAIDELERALDGPARRFVQLAAGAEPLHRLALCKALVGPDRAVTVQEYRKVVGASWTRALQRAYASPVLDVLQGTVFLRERVEEILLGRPVGRPLKLPTVRPEVKASVERVRPTVDEPSLVFHCSDRDFALEYAHAWAGEGLAAWTTECPSSTAWARLQADQSLLWLPDPGPFLHDLYPAHEGLQYLASAPEHGDLDLTRVILDPLSKRLNGPTDPARDGDAEPHLATTAWSTPQLDLDSLVVPEKTAALLAAAAERARSGGRCVVLLHGPPGTGKSLAARCLAGSLGRRTYHWDGARLRGMFYGQLERRIARVLHDLDDEVLVIDEADAWFGRREGSAGAQHSANVNEVTTMLLMLERFQGVAILTTNRLEQMDPAFWRRIDLEVEMPTPGLLERMALWGRVAPDIRPATLAVLAALPLTGGDIEATVSEAALRGTDDVHLVESARRRAQRRRLLG